MLLALCSRLSFAGPSPVGRNERARAAALETISAGILRPLASLFRYLVAIRPMPAFPGGGFHRGFPRLRNDLPPCLRELRPESPEVLVHVSDSSVEAVLNVHELYRDCLAFPGNSFLAEEISMATSPLAEEIPSRPDS